MEINVSVQGVDGVLQRLDRVDKGLNNQKPFLKQVGALLIASSQANFIAGGRPRWPALSETTLYLRARRMKDFRTHKSGPNKGRITEATFDKHIAGAKVLRDTGLLMASVGNTAKGGIYKLGDNAVTVGTKVRGAVAHQFGLTGTSGAIKGKKVPARPFLGFTEKDRVNTYDMAVVFVDKVIEEKG